MASAWPVSSSCAAAEWSGWTICTNSTLSNWCWRIMPRTSRPPEPASERKHGVWQTSLSGSASGEDFVAHDVGHRHFGGRDQVQRVLIATQHLEQVFLELGQLAGANRLAALTR
jgi:outer membrane protein assembly factor BamB